ncbi:transcription initiation factor IIB [Candidatus Bathyarchaeota archaeon]|nr:transcription initiation factor IIB [Candidatus Bathyarchaeota archaeon]NIU80794.1 transcription initiation factor IIB [Candidatus Bathyarchaeota archaeon]NIV67419.1 transcription initiation factor IIB [Candidatus Bathyarchaeota archaeon]NIW15963.1 transcription initiation factor IIB [Candidatus Bathyarchaeota archaeon]NIW34065.1 transcription initiation factor IIB [Candidatus Bathyarchaeota archaeon]
MSQKSIEQLRCPECGGTQIVEDRSRGEYVCAECGFVVKEEKISQRPEWRAFTPEEKQAKSRAGAPTDYSRYDKGLSTIIRVDRDAFGRPLSPKVRRQMWRLRKWHIRAKMHESKSRNLMHAMNELDRLSDKLHISNSVRERAAMIYRDALDKDLTRGRAIDGIMAGSLYAACRLSHLPTSLDRFAEVSTRDKKEIARAYRLLLRRLHIQMPIHDPIDYVSKIAEKARLSGEIQGRAVRIIKKAKRKRLTMGKDPRGVAAAVLYIACKMKGKKVTQKQIASAANITEVTLRNRKKDLVEALDLDV